MARRPANRGQSILEVLIAIFLGALLFVGAASLISPTLQTNKNSNQIQVQNELAKQELDDIRVFSEGNWPAVQAFMTSTNAYDQGTYSVIASSSPFSIFSGTQLFLPGSPGSKLFVLPTSTYYAVYFTVSDVYRDANGNVTSTAAGNPEDPSSRFVTVVVGRCLNYTPAPTLPQLPYCITYSGPTSSLTTMLTRWNTAISTQSDWSGGALGAVTTTVPNGYASVSSTINVNAAGAITLNLTQGGAGHPGYMYVSDFFNNRVEKFSSSGAYVSQIGCATGGCSGTSSNGGFNSGPGAVAVDASGNLWVTDQIDNRVEKFDASGNYISQLGCPSGGCISTSSYTDTELSSPRGVVADSSGNIYVADQNANRVTKFDPNGNFLFHLGCASGTCTSTTTLGRFNRPWELAVDANNNLWVSDYSNSRVQEFSATGTFLTAIGCGPNESQATSTNGCFNGPRGITFDSSGNMWVSDVNNNRVEKFDTTDTYLNQLGCATGGCTATSSNGGFSGPRGLSFDANGNLWVADYNNNRVEEFNSAGAYVAQIGCATGGCSVTSTNGGFDNPPGIFIY